MDRLGLRADELRQAHPGLIWCSLPGFGRTDRRAGLQGWEGVVCSAAALYPLSQHQPTGGPLFSAIPYASNFAGLIAAHSVVAALLARSRSGMGDAIEVALYDAAAESLKAIDARDVTSLMNSGETLDTACESCHRNYWYRIPPPEGAAGSERK